MRLGAEVIDIHPHIISRNTARYPAAPVMGKQSDWSRERGIDIDALITAMDEVGGNRAAIVQASTVSGFDNSCVADAVALHPDRVTGVFSVDVLAEDTPARIAEWHERSLTGLRVFSRGSTIAEPWLALDDPHSLRAFAVAAERRLPVCTNLRATEEQLAQVHAVLRASPDLIMLLDHLGGPLVRDGPSYAAAAPLFGLARYSSLHIKLTSLVLKRLKASGGQGSSATFLPRLVAELGADGIAFGSNYPASEGTPAALVGPMAGALSCLAEADQRAILAGTARRLYPALAAPKGTDMSRSMCLRRSMMSAQ